VITVQFETYRKGYPLYLRGKINVIPNKIPNFSPKAKPNSEILRYLFAGRLSNQKQITQLVQAFIQFHANHRDTELLIFGEGELESELRKMLLDCHAETYIQLNPATKNIDEALKRGDVMVAPSLWEGFPNSVAEALAYGLPVGGFNDCEGVRDLIVNQENGWLVSREDLIASQVSLLEMIYQDREKLPEFSHTARLSVRNFQGEGPDEYWSQLVNSLVSE
jgi:glycosyltransferase involved in cell wall biosynthesis